MIHSRESSINSNDRMQLAAAMFEFRCIADNIVFPHTICGLSNAKTDTAKE